jgi:hypothetical protein
MKQTAVEWQFNELQKAEKDWKNDAIDGIEYTERKYDILKQSKEMEKEYIVNAHFNGCGIGEIFAYENREFITDSEQYYNETFKQ